jgi:glycosyltransferase involved in cell wall biosynthesis
MEKYLDRSVGSLLVPEVLDKLEIIIVNDGSKDRTLEIANGYKAKYPQSVIVIDKPNGHYGSTVNAALKIATGKYFRILDADDWFNSDALAEFVNKLDTIEVDCIYTHFTSIYEDKHVLSLLVNVEYNKIFDLSRYEISNRCLHMHCLTYRRSLLTEIGYTQTEGICYTDTEYVYMPLIQAKNICHLDLNVYQYFIGRDDQSMSKESLAKNYAQFLVLLDRMIDFDKSQNWAQRNASADIIFHYYFWALMSFLLAPCFIYNTPSSEATCRIRAVMDYLKTRDSEVFNKILHLTYYRIKVFKLWYSYGILGTFILWIVRKRLQ